MLTNDVYKFLILDLKIIKWIEIKISKRNKNKTKNTF